ncbi:hypothetical protein AB2L28_04950 [Kineococcus sp. TBRC 1896]|uniref:Uncharacterized protein n=1 Tax=Kineococcus mangrovi TaxID=1660183 RepID=A0ABV4I1K0_9ACTN
MSEPTQDPTPDAPQGEVEREGTAFVQVTRRRAPRFRSFGLTGLVVAFVVSGAIAITTPPSDGYSQQALFGYLFCSLGLVLVLLGALVAVLVDRRTGTRAEPRRRSGKRSGV